MSLYIPKLFGHTLYCYEQSALAVTSFLHPSFFFSYSVDMDGNGVESRTLALLGTWIGCLIYLKQEKTRR
jgi:hypothetical protein